MKELNTADVISASHIGFRHKHTRTGKEGICMKLNNVAALHIDEITAQLKLDDGTTQTFPLLELKLKR